MELEKKSYINKKVIVLILFLIILLTFIICFKTISIENKDKKYSLQKFINYDKPIERGIQFEYSNGYYFLSGMTKDMNSYFTIFKDGKQITSINADVYDVYKTDIYYTHQINSVTNEEEYQLIDYDNKGLSKQTYQSLEYIDNDKFIASQGNKFGIIDKYGKEILPFEYTNISLTNNSKYLFVFNQDYGGVADINGKFIIPLEYEYTINYSQGGDKIYSLGTLCEIDNHDYFILNKNDKNFVINETNEIILESNRTIKYNHYISKFEIYYTENNLLDHVEYYSKDGKLEKTLKIESNWNYLEYDRNFDFIKDTYTNEKENNLMIIQDKNNKNTIYVVDSNLNVKKIDNVPYTVYAGDDEYYKYFVNDSIYIVKNDKYSMYDFKTEKKIADYISIYGLDNNFLLCKEEDKLCSIATLDANSITDFEYSYMNKNSYIAGYLKSKGKYISLNDLTIIFNCHDGFDFSKIAEGHKVNEKLFKTGIGLLEQGDLYDLNCNKINKQTYSSSTIANNYVIAVIDNSNNKKLFDIYDKNNKLIEYENKDNAMIQSFLGYANNALFFLTDKGIYNINVKDS